MMGETMAMDSSFPLNAAKFRVLSALIISLIGSVPLSNGSPLDTLERRQAVPTDLPTGWEYQGCYSDSVASRTLNAIGYASGTSMSAAACISYCTTAGYKFAGTEYAAECYCGNHISSLATLKPDTDCSFVCSGEPTEVCGGDGAITIYDNTAMVAPEPPAANPGPPPNWEYLGCYSEGTGGRALANVGITRGGGGNMTVANCADACAAGNYIFAGVEYGNECWCGNTLDFGSMLAPDLENQCTKPCNGNSTEQCGGASRLNLYQRDLPVPTSTSAVPGGPDPTSSTLPEATPTWPAPAGWTVLGCYTDAAGGRTLSQNFGVGAPVTIELCTSACSAAGFILAGTEYGGECWCGNSIQNSGGPAPDGYAQCNMPCAGNPDQTCGGPNRLSLYASAPIPSGSATVTPPVTVNPPASTTSSAVPLPTVSGWSYGGCYVDMAYGRTLRFQQPDSQTLTPESCIATCSGLGYTVAALQYSAQCFCDNYLVFGATAAPEADCNMPCSGDATKKCGAGNRNSVYYIGTLQILPVPAAQETGLPGSWEYQGCITDPGLPVRTFEYQTILQKTNDAETCLTLCQKFGYAAAGMEYGEECFCGDNKNVAENGAEFRPESECNTICPGNASYYCGAGNRLSYYKWTGPDLEVWHTPSGNEAGEYQFIHGGVVIPLISTPSVNGKVQFLEKKGTGPPNSTGAYEFDYTTLEHRELNLKTDVFCAAALVLPDRAGRQINVGGWSLDSTYGVRFLTPSGSPGVWGDTDYEEDWTKVSLQQGRWYPSIMTMANGSLLVVGGQEGSNGAPVPTLELLPYVSPYKYCDYLERTDPYNLYPYMWVLPSGGIFIAYYNEAKILDPVTLDPIQDLPMIPGAVHNAKGGRTYPLEGSAMVLPQHAPYTDPLTVLICGGSTPFEGSALDNCVSIQPDVPNANWTIERMPSKRVISCMTALPDGTYLIINGAQQGEAGFGLAIKPNLNAVLYDPSKPVNQRMSIMANTTIARMYHSEAVLLQDGRVLVTGSDPQDVRFPQEYRMEVFLPPYLLSGLPKPTFTIANKDWAYGGQYDLTITSGNIANMRVSLIGAESSTHGNTYGQRTFFPEVSCSGTTCTVTAPPNANISPPGWFQVFVLDGPTPSHSTWVRIGGDPGNLGDWPAEEGFNPPGPGPLFETY